MTDTDEQRAKFEPWAQSETPLCLDRAREGSDMYADEDTDFAWLVWNAALAAQTLREIAAENTAAARFERLAGIVRRIRWHAGMVLATEDEQTQGALADLFHWSFHDAMARALAASQEQRHG